MTAKDAKERKGKNRIFSITHIPLRHFATFAALVRQAKSGFSIDLQTKYCVPTLKCCSFGA